MPGPIAVYGATGYTGRLVAAELVRRGREVVVSGRDPGRLAALAEGLGGGATAAPAPLDEPRALRRALGGAAAVVNCAGPFARLGGPVLNAAIATHTHYLDTTGEQSWMQLVLDAYDLPARRAEVTVVPAMGFDYVPGDLLAALVGGPRQPLRALTVAYAIAGFGATRGTLRSVLDVLARDALAYDDGGWTRRPWRPALGERFDFGPPLGVLPVLRFPSGEIVTAPRHLAVDTVRTLMRAPGAGPLPELAPVLTPLAGLALRTPLKGLLDRAIGRLPEGPPEAARRRARFTVACRAEARDGAVAAGVVRGEDPYGLTALIAAAGAERLADGGAPHPGALASAQAVDPAAFLAALPVRVELSR